MGQGNRGSIWNGLPPLLTVLLTHARLSSQGATGQAAEQETSGYRGPGHCRLPHGERQASAGDTRVAGLSFLRSPVQKEPTLKTVLIMAPFY